MDIQQQNISIQAATLLSALASKGQRGSVWSELVSILSHFAKWAIVKLLSCMTNPRLSIRITEATFSHLTYSGTGLLRPCYLMEVYGIEIYDHLYEFERKAKSKWLKSVIFSQPCFSDKEQIDKKAINYRVWLYWHYYILRYCCNAKYQTQINIR